MKRLSPPHFLQKLMPRHRYPALNNTAGMFTLSVCLWAITLFLILILASHWPTYAPAIFSVTFLAALLTPMPMRITGLTLIPLAYYGHVTNAPLAIITSAGISLFLANHTLKDFTQLRLAVALTQLSRALPDIKGRSRKNDEKVLISPQGEPLRVLIASGKVQKDPFMVVWRGVQEEGAKTSVHDPPCALWIITRGEQHGLLEPSSASAPDVILFGSPAHAAQTLRSLLLWLDEQSTLLTELAEQPGVTLLGKRALYRVNGRQYLIEICSPEFPPQGHALFMAAHELGASAVIWSPGHHLITPTFQLNALHAAQLLQDLRGPSSEHRKQQRSAAANPNQQRRPAAPTPHPLAWAYLVLELTPEATPQEVKMRYRQLAKTWHPDLAPAARREQAHTRMQEINEAYRALIQ